MQKNGCGSIYTAAVLFFIEMEEIMKDPFSKCHPAVNFIFFVGVIALTVVIQHPVYLIAGVVTGAIYFLLLNGAKGIKTIAAMLPLFIILTLINPLFNTMGVTPLFYLWGRPYTWEALLYGAALSAMLVIMFLWFGCYNRVLTGDKFTSLFGNLIPAISLLLVMVLRMVPNFISKTRQIIGARKSIGKGAEKASTLKEKLTDGVAVLDTLTGWALEGSIVTGDSMRARGYGAAKRTSFMIYRMTLLDWVLLGIMTALLGLTVTAACTGQIAAAFVPTIELAPPSWGAVAYTCYLLIPIVLHGKEAAQWHISRSKI